MRDPRNSAASLQASGRAVVPRVVAVALVLLVGVPSGRAFVQETTNSGVGLHWKVRSLTYRIHEAGTEDVPGDAEFEAVQRSFRTWQSEPCLPLTFTYGGPTSDDAVGFSDDARTGQDNLVVWRADAESWQHSRTVIALTSVWYDTRSGEIVDADIELNDVDFAFGILTPGEDADGRTDIENAVTHEIGHVVGLGHSSVRSSTMYARSDPGDIDKRTLANDDVDAICTVYADVDGGGGCTSADGASGGGWLLLVVIGLVWRLRPGRRRGRGLPSTEFVGALVGALVACWTVLVSGVAPAAAYVLYTTDDGVPLRWWDVPVSYAVDSAGTATTTGEALLPEVDASFATWQEVPCADVTFRSEGLREGLVAGYDDSYGADNQNAVVWVQTGWSHGARVIGLTTLTFHPVRGEIVDADIEFNEVDFDFTVSGVPDETTTDVRNALTHEIGHLLGLDHSLDPSATMAARSSPGDLDKRDLTDDDVAGFCAIYEGLDFEPDPEPGPEPAPGSDVAAPTHDAAPASDLRASSETDSGAASGCAGAPAGGSAPPFGPIVLALAFVLALLVRRSGGRRRA